MTDWEQLADLLPGDALVEARARWESVTEAEYAYGDFLCEVLDEMKTDRFDTLRAICKQIGADYEQTYEIQRVCRAWVPKLRKKYPLEKTDYRALIEDGKPMLELAAQAVALHWTSREIYAAKREQTAQEAAVKRYERALNHMRIGYPDLPEELRAFGLTAIEAAEGVCGEP